jgi:hypothetical protein
MRDPLSGMAAHSGSIISGAMHSTSEWHSRRCIQNYHCLLVMASITYWRLCPCVLGGNVPLFDEWLPGNVPLVDEYLSKGRVREMSPVSVWACSGDWAQHARDILHGTSSALRVAVVGGGSLAQGITSWSCCMVTCTTNKQVWTYVFLMMVYSDVLKPIHLAFHIW